MNKDCNFKVTIKGAMVDDDGKNCMINRDFTGESVIANVSVDMGDGEQQGQMAVLGKWDPVMLAHMLYTLKNAMGEKFDRAIMMYILGIGGPDTETRVEADAKPEDIEAALAVAKAEAEAERIAAEAMNAESGEETDDGE